jgi:hypothetical protein
MTEYKDISDIAEERDLNVGNDIRVYLRRAIKQSKYSREQICERMSLLTGKNITKAQLDSWTAESKKAHNFSATYLPPFVIASGDTELLDFLCKESGGLFIKPDKLKKELFEIEREIEKLEIRRKEILQSILPVDLNTK